MRSGLVWRASAIRLTLILESCSIAGLPFTWGRVISKTPKLSLVIWCESRFHPSAHVSLMLPIVARAMLTEIAYQICSQSTWGPFSVDDVSV